MSTPTNGVVLKFEAGKPQTIALAYAEGKPSKNYKGADQLFFTTTSGDRLFVAPYVGDRIRAAGIRVGEPFEMELIDRWEGNHRTVEYQVRKLGVRPTAFESTPRFPEMRSNGLAPSVPQDPPAFAPQPLLAQMPVTPPQGPVNGSGETAADILKHAYCDAIDIALYTVECAQKKGLRITPLFEDVRAIAFSISGLGGRR